MRTKCPMIAMIVIANIYNQHLQRLTWSYLEKKSRMSGSQSKQAMSTVALIILHLFLAIWRFFWDENSIVQDFPPIYSSFLWTPCIVRFVYEHVERAIVYRVLSIVNRLQTVHRVSITASYIVHRLPCCYRGSVRLELNYVWLFLRSFHRTWIYLLVEEQNKVLYFASKPAVIPWYPELEEACWSLDYVCSDCKQKKIVRYPGRYHCTSSKYTYCGWYRFHKNLMHPLHVVSRPCRSV